MIVLIQSIGPYKMKLFFRDTYIYTLGFPGGSVVKNQPANARDMDSIPGLGRYPGKEMATHSRILAWRIPWIEEPGGLQSMESQRVRHD